MVCMCMCWCVSSLRFSVFSMLMLIVHPFFFDVFLYRSFFSFPVFACACACVYFLCSFFDAFRFTDPCVVYAGERTNFSGIKGSAGSD